MKYFEHNMHVIKRTETSIIIKNNKKMFCSYTIDVFYDTIFDFK